MSVCLSHIPHCRGTVHSMCYLGPLRTSSCRSQSSAVSLDGIILDPFSPLSNTPSPKSESPPPPGATISLSPHSDSVTDPKPGHWLLLPECGGALSSLSKHLTLQDVRRKCEGFHPRESALSKSRCPARRQWSQASRTKVWGKQR